jgi:2'-5' RNA ligase
VRLFIAIDFPDDIISAFSAEIAGIKDVNWTKPGQIHLTLKFIGDYSVDRLDDLKLNLERLKFEEFFLALSDTGFFPNSRRPSVFWLGIEPSSALSELQRQIEDLLSAECGVCRDEREFVPHVTLARFKRRVSPELIERLQGLFAGFKGKEFKCRNFILFSSKLDRSGAIHKALASFPKLKQ